MSWASGGVVSTGPLIFTLINSDGTNFDKISAIRINNELVKEIGAFKACRKTRDGLLITTLGAEQATKLQSTAVFLGKPVKISPHPVFNFKKGVVRHHEVTLCSEAELLQDLSSQGAESIQVVHRKNSDGQLTATRTAIITFNSTTLPSHVFLGYHRVEVEPHFYLPRRCFKCQTFGHLTTKCTRPEICVCGGVPHQGECATAMCPNCRGPHRADDKSCPAYSKELAVEKFRASNGVSYYEARRCIQQQNSATTYSSVAAATPPAHQTVADMVTQLRPLLRDLLREVVKELFFPKNIEHDNAQPSDYDIAQEPEMADSSPTIPPTRPPAGNTKQSRAESSPISTSVNSASQPMLTSENSASQPMLPSENSASQLMLSSQTATSQPTAYSRTPASHKMDTSDALSTKRLTQMNSNEFSTPKKKK